MKKHKINYLNITANKHIDLKKLNHKKIVFTDPRFSWRGLLQVASVPVQKCNQSNEPNKPIDFIDAIYKFFHIWPFDQWFWSLLVLLLLYIVSTRLHNKYIAPRIGLYITNKILFYLISSDLMLNLVLGIYGMYARDTLIGQFMVQCPVAISPFIFLAEVVGMTIIFIIVEHAKKKDNKPSNK